jgi:hypothetical protein
VTVVDGAVAITTLPAATVRRSVRPDDADVL